jgi:hypothetical protein
MPKPERTRELKPLNLLAALQGWFASLSPESRLASCWAVRLAAAERGISTDAAQRWAHRHLVAMWKYAVTLR